MGVEKLSSFPVSVFSLSLLYIVAVIARFSHLAISYSVIPSLSVILREQSDRRIYWLRTGLSPSPSVILSLTPLVILRSHRPKNLNEWLRINSAKNPVFVFRENSAKQSEEINVVVNKE